MRPRNLVPVACALSAIALIGLSAGSCRSTPPPTAPSGTMALTWSPVSEGGVVGYRILRPGQRQVRPIRGRRHGHRAHPRGARPLHRLVRRGEGPHGRGRRPRGVLARRSGMAPSFDRGGPPLRGGRIRQGPARRVRRELPSRRGDRVLASGPRGRAPRGPLVPRDRRLGRHRGGGGARSGRPRGRQPRRGDLRRHPGIVHDPPPLGRLLFPPAPARRAKPARRSTALRNASRSRRAAARSAAARARSTSSWIATDRSRSPRAASISARAASRSASSILRSSACRRNCSAASARACAWRLPASSSRLARTRSS